MCINEFCPIQNCRAFSIHTTNSIKKKSLWVLQMKHVATHCWQYFRKAFTKETEKTKYVISLIQQNGVCWNAHREKIVSLLLQASPFSRLGHLLKKLLRKIDKSELRAIVHLYFDKTFERSKKNFEKIAVMMDSDIIFGLLTEETIEKLEDRAKNLPSPERKTFRIESEIKKTLRVVLRFFPNFMDTLLKAFNLIEVGKGPETIWDFAAMLEIYFKLFLIPHAIFMLVGRIISVSWQLFVITTGIVVLSVIGICLYLKFRPVPSKLPRAENWTLEAKQGKLEPVVERNQEIQKIRSLLGKRGGPSPHIILVGPSGVGKTEIVKGLAQQLKEKTLFALNGPDLAEGYSSVSDRLRLIFHDVKGHEDEVCFFIDELARAKKINPRADIAGFLRGPLSDRRGVQVLLAMTEEDYKEQIFCDKQFATRFSVVRVKPTTEEQTCAILVHRMETKAQGVRFFPSKKAIAKMIYAKTRDELQPRSAVKLLELAINKVLTPVAQLTELSTIENRLEKCKKDFEDAENEREETRIGRKITTLTEKIPRLQKENAINQRRAQNLRSLMKKEYALVNMRRFYAKKMPKDKMFPFLDCILLPWIKSKITSQIEKVKEVPLQVDKKIILDTLKDISYQTTISET